MHNRWFHQRFLVRALAGLAILLVLIHRLLLELIFGQGSARIPIAVVLLALPAIVYANSGSSRVREWVGEITGIVLLVGSGLILAHQIQNTWLFTTDDAYITLRYAKNLLAGHGLTFNPGSPPVEGYSNFSYLLFAAGALRVGLDPVVFLKSVSTASAFAALLLSFWIFRRPAGPILAGFTSLYLALTPGIPWWTSSGLETSFFLFLFLSVVALLIKGTRESPTTELPVLWSIAGLASFLAAITRPEGVLVPSGLLVAAVWRHTTLNGRTLSVDWPKAVRASLGPVLLAGLLPAVAYHCFRILYFGRFLPNSAMCKAGYDTDPFAVVGPFFHSNTLPILLAPLGFFLMRKQVGFLFGGMVSALAAVAMYGVDPIIAYFDRHLLPYLPLIVGLALIALRGSDKIRRRLGPLLAAVQILVLAYALPNPATEQLVYTSQAYHERNLVREKVARYLDTIAEPGDWVLHGDAGIIPYNGNLHFHDAYCLNSREMTSPAIGKSPLLFFDYVFDGPSPPKIVIVPSKETFELDPHEIHGTVFPLLLEDDRFRRDYELTALSRGDVWGRYWIYTRRSSASSYPGH